MAAAPRYLQVRLAGASLQRGGRCVLSDVHWRILPGQRWVVVGANGSGKTQLLKLVAGIVRASPVPRQQLRWRLDGAWHAVPFAVRQRIAYLGPERQDKYERYDWNLAVEDVVGTGLYATDIPLDALTAADRRRIAGVLERLGIGKLARQRFLELSYGQRRMVLLARALAGSPGLLILDEVFTGLDRVNHARLQRWLARLRGRLPVLMATHELADIPATATHALVLRRGRVLHAGPLAAAASQLRGLAASGHAARGGPRPRAAPRTPQLPLVRLERAHVHLDGFHALHDVSMNVQRGDFWVIHGPNGSGKTTLLRTLYGDHGVATGGSIARAGIGPGVPLEHFRERTGMSAPYVHACYPRNYTVAQVVLSGRHSSIGLQRGFNKADHDAAARVMRRLGLARWARRSLAELSYGQTRLVLLARALVRSPRLLLLDEPFDSLDGANRALLAREMHRLAGQGVAIVVTAHLRGEWTAYATHELEVVVGQVRYAGPLRTTNSPRIRS